MSSAIAFLVAGLTEFTGVAELGLVAGGGIVLCLLAAMAVLPAIIKLCDAPRSDAASAHAPGLPPLDQAVRGPAAAGPDRAASWSRRPWPSGMTRLRYDYNLLHLQPAGLESVELEQKLLAETKESVYFALSMAKTPGGSRRPQGAISCNSLRWSGWTRSPRGFPPALEEKRPIIERIRNRLAGLPERPPQIPVASPTELGQMLSADAAADVRQLADGPLPAASCRRSAACWASCRPTEYYARLSEYQQRVAADLLDRLHLLHSVANPEPPQAERPAGGLASRFVGRNGSHLLRIYVKGDFWDIENMRQFVAQVRTVDRGRDRQPGADLRSLAADAAELRARGAVRPGGDPAGGLSQLRHPRLDAPGDRSPWRWPCCRCSA